MFSILSVRQSKYGALRQIDGNGDRNDDNNYINNDSYIDSTKNDSILRMKNVNGYSKYLGKLVYK